MRSKRLLAAIAATSMAVPAFAESVDLIGVVRDFQADHPDMQSASQMGGFGVVQGLVADQLGEDGKPVYNPTRPSKDTVYSADSFNEWYNDVNGVNKHLEHTITLEQSDPARPNMYIFAVEKQQIVDGKPQYFFPIDGRGWADEAEDANGDLRNFYFTYEIHTEFTYTDPLMRDHDLVFGFTGDDDVWVFINGRLAVDIGGVHGQASASVNLDEQAEALGLVPGQVYNLDFFFAERHRTQSNFRFETTIPLTAIPPTEINPLFD